MKEIVAIYCRVSTQTQSTDRQREELLALSKEKGWDIPDDRIYIDVVSGFKDIDERIEFKQMLNDIQSKGITTIMFSEFTRLARNVNELLKQIENLTSKGIRLFFQKQDLWVSSDKRDLGSTILLHILAVMASYEIELFAERSMSGKINKVQQGAGGGLEHTYGYKLDEAKKLKIDEETANVIRRIFREYASGRSSIQICESLNAEGISSPYKYKLGCKREKDRREGKEVKVYKKFDIDEMVWRTSSLTRLLSNETYRGRKHIVFHRPDPSNPLPVEKRQDREIVYEYFATDENLRIISDELWTAVQDRLAKASYNKNNAVKRENFVKHLMVCGECGSNFSVQGHAVNSQYVTTANKYNRLYACYGNRKALNKPRICNEGGQIMMSRMDGLVVQFSLMMFAQTNLKETNERMIADKQKRIDDLTIILQSKEIELSNLLNGYKQKMRRFASMQNEDIAQELMREAEEEFQTENGHLNVEITKAKETMAKLKNEINSVKRLNDNLEQRVGKKTIHSFNKTIAGDTFNDEAKEAIAKLKTKIGKVSYNLANKNIFSRMDEIRNDRTLLKTMVDEYVTKITVYRMHKLWFLVVVDYKNGVQMWGKIKSARYKNAELFYDPLLSQYGTEFQTWCINNTDRSFSYDKERKVVTFNGNNKLYQGLDVSEYDYESLNKYMVDNSFMGSFPLYFFEDNHPENE